MLIQTFGHYYNTNNICVVCSIQKTQVYCMCLIINLVPHTNRYEQIEGGNATDCALFK